jgi:hypothetical protein
MRAPPGSDIVPSCSTNGELGIGPFHSVPGATTELTLTARRTGTNDAKVRQPQKLSLPPETSRIQWRNAKQQAAEELPHEAATVSPSAMPATVSMSVRRHTNPMTLPGLARHDAPTAQVDRGQHPAG